MATLDASDASRPRKRVKLQRGVAAAPVEACDELPPVPRVGLSLAALRAFADAHAKEQFWLSVEDGAPPTLLRFDELTTAQVVDAIVKPATRARAKRAACTYAELLTVRTARRIHRCAPG